MNRIAGNPFVVTNFYSLRDYLQIGFMSVFALIRLAFFALFMITSGISGHILHFIKDIHDPKDYTQWKKYYIFLPILFIRFALYSLGFFKIDIVDKSTDMENDLNSKTPVIQLLVPHSSIVDYFAVCFLGLPAFVARSQTKEVWIISKLVSLGNAITVDRNDKHSRKETVEIIRERASKERVILFPEGTNTNREMMIKFKLGAFIPSLPVQPVFIKYSDHNIDSYSWAWEGPSATLGFFLTSCKLYSKLTLVKLPIYYPNEEEQRNPSLFAQNVQKLIEKECNIKLSQYVYDDAQYLQLAETLKIPRSPIGLKLLKLFNKVSQLRQLNNKYITYNGAARRETINASNGDKNFDEIRIVFEEATKYFFKHINFTKVKEIQTGKDVLLALNLYHQYPSLEASSIVQEFLSTLSGFSKRNELITTKHLAMVLLLCNVSKVNMWERVNDLIVYVNKIKSDLKCNVNSCDEANLTISEYKYLVWCLIGLESYLLNVNHLDNVVIDYDYLKENFVKTFTRAVKENASSLINEKF